MNLLFVKNCVHIPRKLRLKFETERLYPYFLKMFDPSKSYPYLYEHSAFCFVRGTKYPFLRFAYNDKSLDNDLRAVNFSIYGINLYRFFLFFNKKGLAFRSYSADKLNSFMKQLSLDDFIKQISFTFVDKAKYFICLSGTCYFTQDYKTCFIDIDLDHSVISVPAFGLEQLPYDSPTNEQIIDKQIYADCMELYHVISDCENLERVASNFFLDDEVFKPIYQNFSSLSYYQRFSELARYKLENPYFYKKLLFKLLSEHFLYPFFYFVSKDSFTNYDPLSYNGALFHSSLKQFILHFPEHVPVISTSLATFFFPDQCASLVHLKFSNSIQTFLSQPTSYIHSSPYIRVNR